MRRKIFTSLWLLSLMLWLVTLAWGLRSYWKFDRLIVQPNVRHQACLTTVTGLLQLDWVGLLPDTHVNDVQWNAQPGHYTAPATGGLTASELMSWAYEHTIEDNHSHFALEFLGFGFVNAWGSAEGDSPLTGGAGGAEPPALQLHFIRATGIGADA